MDMYVSRGLIISSVLAVVAGQGPFFQQPAYNILSQRQAAFSPLRNRNGFQNQELALGATTNPFFINAEAALGARTNIFGRQLNGLQVPMQGFGAIRNRLGIFNYNNQELALGASINPNNERVLGDSVNRFGLFPNNELALGDSINPLNVHGVRRFRTFRNFESALGDSTNQFTRFPNELALGASTLPFNGFRRLPMVNSRFGMLGANEQILGASTNSLFSTLNQALGSSRSRFVGGGMNSEQILGDRTNFLFQNQEQALGDSLNFSNDDRQEQALGDSIGNRLMYGSYFNPWNLGAFRSRGYWRRSKGYGKRRTVY